MKRISEKKCAFYVLYHTLLKALAVEYTYEPMCYSKEEYFTVSSKKKTLEGMFNFSGLKSKMAHKFFQRDCLFVLHLN